MREANRIHRWGQIKPTLYVVAGPNGCGKSSFTQSRLRHLQVVDPDAIARRIDPKGPRSAAVAAGREAIRVQRAAVVARDTFAVETTLSGVGVFHLMAQAKTEGYKLELHFVCVNSVDEALNRIASRVAKGGHDVPEEDVRRRFGRALANLAPAIALSDESRLYDNSDLDEPYRIVAVLTDTERWFATHVPSWVPVHHHNGEHP